MAIVAAIAVPHPPLIVPAVGKGEEARIQDTIDAYEAAARAVVEAKPDCIVVTSPHAPMFRDGFHVTTDARLEGSMARFRAPHERIDAVCDADFARAVVARANAVGIAAVGSERYRDDMDHGTFVPLFFVREAYRAQVGNEAIGDLPCPIVRIGLSGLSPQTHRELGRIIAQVADEAGKRIAFVASGDLSHKLLEEGPYGFAPEGPVFDEQIGHIFTAGELDRLFEFDEDFCEAAAECGLRSFQIMAGALDGLTIESHLLSNEGPFGVGYGVAIMEIKDAQGGEVDGEPADNADAAACASVGGANVCDKEAGIEKGAETESDPTADSECGSSASASTVPEADPHIMLARLTVEHYVRTGRMPELPENVPEELLTQRAGVFVSLHEHGELRGCIGTIAATTASIAQEILQNGVSACSRDPRFDPVRPDELDYLEYSVDVLGDAEPISSPAELDVRRYGVIVTKGWKRGLLLPNLDGVDTVAYQLEIAKRKAGISPSDDDVDLERFEVVRHTRGGEPRR